MIDWIRTFLIPKDEEVVRLQIKNPYYKKEYLTKIIDYLDRKGLMIKAGFEEDLSPTDIFTLQVLGNSCSYTPEDYKEWRESQRKVKRKSKKAKLDNAQAQS